MKYRKLDAAGDYVLGSGSDFLIDTPEAVGQAVLTRLKLWRGEWFINIEDGTEWETEVLGKRFQNTNPDASIQGRILGTQGVLEISDYSSTFDGNARQLKVIATITTIYGVTTVQETL